MSKTNFSPSVNIIRDQENPQSYIVTQNSKRTAQTIKERFNSNLHCFNIIGSYGSGKSSFILALQNNLKKKNDFFFTKEESFNGQDNYQFINIIGSFTSIIKTFGNAFNAPNSSSAEEVLEALDNHYKKLQNKNTFLFIFFDEYGKALEHAAKNKPEDKMYFMQQLAEYINDKNIILITTLHQNFAQYGSTLEVHERNEWKKVNGRFQDITFNEPIEQLLYLASDYIKNWGVSNNNNFTNNVNEMILSDKIVSNSLNFNIEFAQKIFPLDLISAYSLTKALQTYGQNERSLFTFLNLRSEDSLYMYSKREKNYTLEDVYNFIYTDFYGYILSNDNPYKNAWSAIQIALEKAEILLTQDIEEAKFILKVIGLLNIFTPAGSPITKKFLLKYSSLSDYNITESLISELERRKIIRFREYDSRYNLFEGTDLDFNQALKDAHDKLPIDFNISKHIEQYYQLPYVCAKSISYKTGTPRYYKYIISEEPILEKPQKEIDGFINLIFSEKNIEKEIQKKSQKDNAIIYAYYKNSKKIKDTLIELEKTNIVLKEQQHDLVAKKELSHMRRALQTTLNKEIIKNLTSKNVIWFCQGENINITSQKELNIELSNLCEKIYHKVPTFKNELINKHKVSTAISTARKSYMRAIINNSDKELLDYPIEKFPAQKTIYLSLLKETGIHRQDRNENWIFDSPNTENKIGESFIPLWKECIKFLKETEQDKTNLKELYNRLENKPFKLKEGFLSFWIPTFLIIQQDNFALFNSNGYIPFITEEVLEIMQKKPEAFSIKAFSVSGIKLDLFNTYRTLINKDSKDISNRNSYVETIRPLFKFYRDLPNYTKVTKNISAKARGFRDAIAKAKDPESAFFESIPKALGYTGIDLRNGDIDLNNYLILLKEAIRELRECEQNLYERLENQITNSLNIKEGSFSKYKNIIEERFSILNINILNDNHKRLVSRLIVPTKDKKHWIDGLTSAILNKKISSFRDEDELSFSINFNKNTRILEKLIPIHELNKTKNDNKVIGFEITQINGESNSERIILNNINTEEILHINSSIDTMLADFNENEQKLILLNKLQELCKHE